VRKEQHSEGLNATNLDVLRVKCRSVKCDGGRGHEGLNATQWNVMGGGRHEGLKAALGEMIRFAAPSDVRQDPTPLLRGEGGYTYVKGTSREI
jgi:hypothetical protein